MDESAASQPAARLHARNVGGIDETSVALDSGVNVLVGRNATNRTSFLQSLMAALGSERATLKGDAEEGHVELEYDGETYERTLRRVDDGVVFGGEGVLDDPELADLFAFLLESNEARRAVEQGDDLREIIVRPVDTASLRREIERLEDEKRDIDAELADLDDAASRLANREARVEDLEAEREDVREKLAAAREALDETESSEGDDEALSELKEARSELEDVRFRLRTERESLESLRDQRADLREELDGFPEGDVDVNSLDEKIEAKREELSELESEINDLQGVIRFNEEMLEDAGSVGQALAESGGSDSSPRSDGGAVTDALLEDSDERVCWTCGTRVDTERIEETVDRLVELREQKLSRKSDLKAALDDLTEKRRDVNTARERRDGLEASLADVDAEIEEREARVEDLEAERADLEDEVADLESAVEATEENETALDRAKRVNELEFELDRVEDELADVRETVADLASQLSEREDLESRRANVVSELTELRERVDRVETEAVEAFNDHMETVLELLGYDNIERIWIERTTTTQRQGREKVEQSTFELHVVRSSDGAAYEDTVEHLSESEREVTGLVFALAGALVHDVFESVPFVLLDSMEAIDSERIASLVEYVADHAEFTVVALLEEDASALEEVDNRITDI